MADKAGAAFLQDRGRDHGGDPPDPLPALEHYLPSAVLASVFSRLDPRSLCYAAATCRSFHSVACHALSFLPSFHLLDISPTLNLLRPLLLPNSHLKSLKLDCSRLDDSSIGLLARPSLHEVCLHNCENLSGRLLSEIGEKCRDLRLLSLSSLSERRGRSYDFFDLEGLITGCSQLEQDLPAPHESRKSRFNKTSRLRLLYEKSTEQMNLVKSLILALDFSPFDNPNFGQVWATASVALSSLEIGYMPTRMLIELLGATMKSRQSSSPVKPSMFPSLQMLCLSVDYITDHLVGFISKGLPSLSSLDLQDAPVMEPISTSDLTNAGLQQINLHGKLKHISLIRSQEFLFTAFRRVNDLGILLMSDRCASLESICLGGFCRVTDTGYRAIIHSCTNLRKFRVSHGSQLTDLVFHDIFATSLSLTHVSLRWCTLLSDIGIVGLSNNKQLIVLDLRDCRILGDEALKAVSRLPKLQVLLLDGTDTSDLGLSYLGHGNCPLVSLSLRGCKRITENGISFLFNGSLNSSLQGLDLSRLPNLTDNGIFFLAKSRIPIVELRLRECPRIGDASVMALASMQIEGRSPGGSLYVLDMFECGGITPLAFRWFKKPYFSRLRWLGVTGCLNRDMVDALSRSRPFLRIACRGEELGMSFLDASGVWYAREEDEIDELEQWLLEGEEDDAD